MRGADYLPWISSQKQATAIASQNEAMAATPPTKMPRPLNNPATAPTIATAVSSPAARRSSLVHRPPLHRARVAEATVLPMLHGACANVLQRFMQTVKPACVGSWIGVKVQSRRGGDGEIIVTTV